MIPALLAIGCAATQSPKGWAAPVEYGDGVIAQTSSGTISALRLEGSTATELWHYPLDDDAGLKAVYATPLIDRNVIYVASYSGRVVALNASGERAGRPVDGWGGSIDLGGRIVATPALRGDTLYVATEQGDVFAIDTATGTHQLLVSLGARVWSALRIRGDGLYVGAFDDRLYAIDLASGAQQWQRNVGAVAGDTVVDGDVLLVPSLDQRTHAVDLAAEGGSERWPDGGRGDAWFWATPLVGGDSVYAVTVEGSLFAFDRDSGDARWPAPFRAVDVATEFRSSPLRVGGVLVVASTDGDVFAVDPASGRQQWTKKAGGARFFADPLLLESGVVLYVDDSGDLWRLFDITTAGARLERVLLSERG